MVAPTIAAMTANSPVVGYTFIVEGRQHQRAGKAERGGLRS
jgi:hypothetical protein